MSENKPMSGKEYFEAVKALYTPDVSESKAAMEEKKTARRYNEGKRRWRNIPLYLFEPVIEVGEKGEIKYETPESPGTLNYLNGLSVVATLDSIKRHLKSFESPHESDLDKESGLNHILHVAWNCIAMYETLLRHPEFDDRPQTVEVRKLNELARLKGKQND